MGDLETLNSSGGDIRELGNNHKMDLPDWKRRTVRLIFVDVHVNLNLVPLELVADLLHQLSMSICHLWRL